MTIGSSAIFAGLGDGGDGVAAAGKFRGDARTGPTGGAGDGDGFMSGISSMWYPAVTRYPMECNC
jgi:hypothetical protein